MRQTPYYRKWSYIALWVLMYKSSFQFKLQFQIQSFLVSFWLKCGFCIIKQFFSTPMIIIYKQTLVMDKQTYMTDKQTNMIF